MDTNVLILDDQLELADPIRRLAHLNGWRTHFVGSLQELELAMQAMGLPQLVVVNWRPPVTSWELQQWLRGLRVDVPVVVLSESRNENGNGAPGAVGVDARAMRRMPSTDWHRRSVVWGSGSWSRTLTASWGSRRSFARCLPESRGPPPEKQTCASRASPGRARSSSPEPSMPRAHGRTGPS
jgi:CheY-like chemotaxis protein